MSEYFSDFTSDGVKMYVGLKLWSELRKFKLVTNVLIDTGSPYTILSDVEIQGVNYNDLGICRICNGIDGIPFEIKLVEVPILRIGNMNLMNHPIWMYSLKKGQINRAFLGNDILSCFNYTINNANSEIIFEKFVDSSSYHDAGLKDFNMEICSIESTSDIEESKIRETALAQQEVATTIDSETEELLLSYIKGTLPPSMFTTNKSDRDIILDYIKATQR